MRSRGKKYRIIPSYWPKQPKEGKELLFDEMRKSMGGVCLEGRITS